MNQKDVGIIRELAKQYMEYAASEKYERMRRRFRDTNDLKLVRPPLNVEEIPWAQMDLDGSLTCVCEDPKLREMEGILRQGLFRARHFACDNYLLPYWVVSKSYTETPYDPQTTEEQLTQGNSYIVSHKYEDVLADEESLKLFRIPLITPHPEEDEKNLAFAAEVLGDTMPVELRGAGIYYAPWDRITTLRGVEPVLEDMYERPEYLHKIIGCYAAAMRAEMDQMLALGLYDPMPHALHCTPGEVTKPEGMESRPAWFRTMAQTFSSISPKMHYELDIAYSIPLAKECAYTYYGCCEPLHDRLDVVKRFPNLRKVGVSPWANVEKMADETRGSLVLSRKPNPANVALRTDETVVRKEIEDTVKLCQKYGCPVDITLKDISTVGNRPENLIEWTKIASDVLDAYYGKA